MKKYKVKFENNKAIAAEEVDLLEKVDIRIDYVAGKSCINWVVIYASDELDAVITATDIVKQVVSGKNAA